MDKVRLGYVGCGFMAQKVHIPNFVAQPDCDIVAIAEVRADIRERVANRYGIPKRYANHLEMAEDKEIDAVGVSAGYALQGEMAIDFLKRGKPVFMEKPMATTIEAAQRILDAEKQGGGKLMIGYMKRYDLGNIIARDTIRSFRGSADMGEMKFIRAHGFCGDWIGGLDTPLEHSSEDRPPSPAVVPDWLPEEYNRPYLSYLQQYTHNINLIRWLVDAGDDAKVRMVDLNDNDTGGIVILEVAGVRAVIESGSMTYHGWDENTQVYFQHGYVKTTSPSLLLKNIPATVEVYKGKPTPSTCYPVPSPAYSWSYTGEAQHFVEKVKSGEPFDSSAEDTMTDVRLYEEIYQDSRQRRGEL